MMHPDFQPFLDAAPIEGRRFRVRPALPWDGKFTSREALESYVTIVRLSDRKICSTWAHDDWCDDDTWAARMWRHWQRIGMKDEGLSTDGEAR